MIANSSLVPYALCADLIVRQDVGFIAQMSVDDGIIPDEATLLDITTIPGSRVYELLLASSGQIEFSATLGGKYSPSDLQSLNGASLSFLKTLVCDITVMALYDRRDARNPPENVVEKYKFAQSVMKDLVDGKGVFGDLENQQAGAADTKLFRPQDYDTMNLISSRWGRAYGNREKSKLLYGSYY